MGDQWRADVNTAMNLAERLGRVTCSSETPTPSLTVLTRLAAIYATLLCSGVAICVSRDIAARRYLDQLLR
jgi:hypothetical protein